MTDLHPHDDVLLDLALGDLDQATSDVVMAHLEQCDACRQRCVVLTSAVEHLLAAAPPVPPPPGFSRLVLESLGMAAGSRPTGIPTGQAAIGWPVQSAAQPVPVAVVPVAVVPE